MADVRRRRSNEDEPVASLPVMASERVASVMGELCLPMISTTSTGFVNAVKGVKESLRVFGLKTSHILRSALLTLFATAGLSHEAQLWVYLFCSLAKTKARIVAGISRLPSHIREESSVVQALVFIREHMVTWPSEETDKKFATVHVSATNPGLSTLLWSITRAEPGAQIPTEDIFMLTWFPQMNLSDAVLTDVKEKQAHYWNQVVRSSRTGKTPPGFKEDIWKNQVSDKYPLACLVTEPGRGTKIVYVEPNNKERGFTFREIEFWWSQLLKALYPSASSGIPIPTPMVTSFTEEERSD